MSERGVIVVGTGRRVRADVLPALARLAGLWRVTSLFARSGRVLELGGEAYDVRPLDELSDADLAAAELIYVCVAKPAVPAVLQRLARHDRSTLDLLVETPVLLFRHLHHLPLLDGYRQAWAAEDCSTLPWLDVLPGGGAGAVRSVRFDRSAWRYHGLALLKTLAGSPRVRRARRHGAAGGTSRVRVRLANGARGVVLEPRDYAAGHLHLEGPFGTITDRAGAEPPGGGGDGPRLLAPEVRDGRCVGFRCGDARMALSPEESDLMGPIDPGETVTARMEDCKRVGLYRMLKTLHAGGAGYPLAQALEDMVVDHLLEKARVYLASPFTDVTRGTGRALLRFATRLLDRR